MRVEPLTLIALGLLALFAGWLGLDWRRHGFWGALALNAGPIAVGVLVGTLNALWGGGWVVAGAALGGYMVGRIGRPA